jgi:hypothetical protein
MDPRLIDFALVRAVPGTPRHSFATAPADLQCITGAALAEFTIRPGPDFPSLIFPRGCKIV